MAHNYTFKLTSECPIEVVYGVTAETLNAIKSENTDASGYDWIPILNDVAEQREEFLSGLAKEDAELFVTNEADLTLKFDFRYSFDVNDDEDLRAIIVCDENLIKDSGHELDEEAVDYIIVARVDLKYRNWVSKCMIENDFDKNKVTIEVKNRDSEVKIAEIIYSSFDSDHEESIVGLFYDGVKINFEEDFTSYPPTFLCLKKTPSGWERDEDLEYFFEGVE